jgi:hypothetical protein
MASKMKIWQMPVLLAIVSTLGVASALLGDGWADALSWLALTMPVLTIFWHNLKPARV